jgi:zinc transport system substrate-binding protein
MPMKKRIITEGLRLVLIVTFLFIFDGTICAGNLKVAASFYPLAHFAGEVGGDLADVTNIMPPGAEPHEFEPTPRDIGKIYKADIFIFHGEGLDPWARKISADLEQKGILIRQMSDYFTFLKLTDDEHHHENRMSDRAEHAHEHGESDPHIWLDPILASREVEIIRDAFIQADPSHKEAYIKNSASYMSKLGELDRKYRRGLQSCASRDVIVTHDAFNYLAKRYDLQVYPIMGISPEEEPSPRKLVELSKMARAKKITHIFFETLVSPKLAETIAGETGAKTLVLNPLGGLTGEDIRKGKTYISVMEENLQNLRIALQCK